MLVFNLVENAIKYNHPDGSVYIDIKDENGFALISIKDTGIGIAPENQEKIFTPFSVLINQEAAQWAVPVLDLH